MNIKIDVESDPFPKWSWMMKYCKSRGMSPTMGWKRAEKAYQDAKQIEEISKEE